MPYVLFAIIIVITGVIVFSLQRKAAYYRKIFSDDHYREVGSWLNSVLKLGTVDKPNLDANTAFQSSAGCAFTFTREIGERDVIHIAISQIGNPTTHAVSNRLAFLIIQMLNRNKADADFYYTESTVHHLLFEKDAGGKWVTNDVGSVVAEMESHEHIPFRFQSVQENA